MGRQSKVLGLTLDPDAEEQYPPLQSDGNFDGANASSPLARRSARRRGGGGGSDGGSLSPIAAKHRALGRRPFNPISPTLKKNQTRIGGDAAQPSDPAAGPEGEGTKRRPFGTGSETTEDQKYRRFLEIKDEIRKRARRIESSKHDKAKLALPPLTGQEKMSLFLNSFEAHSLVAALFLNIVYFLGLGRAIQTISVVHAALLAFWVVMWYHAKRSGLKRLEEYAEFSRNVTIAPFVSLLFYLAFAHFHRWKWWDVAIAFVIVASPPFLQRLGRNLARVGAKSAAVPVKRRAITDPQTGTAQGPHDSMDLAELEEALRKLRVQNRARRAKPTTVAIKRRRDDPPVVQRGESKKNI